ncbi:uncharacterized protein LOC135494179 [Lineus longissimus]|uniref:uncharacterized protein LOC135494179 n=1 Tax=Lineus longissimus TaxID=88925 RepID=UPI002B4F68B1
MLKKKGSKSLKESSSSSSRKRTSTDAEPTEPHIAKRPSFEAIDLDQDTKDKINSEFEAMFPDNAAWFLLRWRHSFALKIIEVAKLEKTTEITDLLTKYGDGNNWK